MSAIQIPAAQNLKMVLYLSIVNIFQDLGDVHWLLDYVVVVGQLTSKKLKREIHIRERVGILIAKKSGI